MGRQDSFIKIMGQVGGLSFYKSSTDGYLMRRATGVDRNRIKTDPAFARTRENAAEFGRAGSAAKLMRTALSSFVKRASDNKVSSRLTRELIRVIRADQTSERGKRNVVDGEAALLEGFEFNINASLSAILVTPFTKTINRAEGKLSVHFPAFVSSNVIKSPTGATHCKFFAVAAEIDFERGTYLVNSKESQDIVLGVAETPAIALEMSLTPGSTRPLFLVFGLEFNQQVNGKMYLLKTSESSAMGILGVDGGGEEGGG